MVRLTKSITGTALLRVCAVLALVFFGWAAFSAASYASQPVPWEIAMQPPATPVKERIQEFHNELLVIITLITLFVLGLLLYVMVKFNARAHPVPTRTTHNPVIEVIWTIAPVIILVIVAVPSFKLMYYMDRVPNPDMTIKVTGHQWYWEYTYPDQGNIDFNSNLIPDDQLKPGQPRLLEVDNPLVVPVGTNVRVQVTGTDVIHSWFIPSFGVQEYAVVGRLNESWFNVEREGDYYGECNQICGVNHAFMPIKVVAMSKADFQKWLVDAKKKFAANSPDIEKAPGAPDATLVAAAADVRSTGGAAVPAGNR
ncbi:MAG: cytochrome c oxidase subunit II [Alphaproteobacteria bacterium]|nr:cytochrome c oxidase subunit II [Alphaproteobacteria bacterium]